jgi:outer membrane usher protein
MSYATPLGLRHARLLVVACACAIGTLHAQQALNAGPSTSPTGVANASPPTARAPAEQADLAYVAIKVNGQQLATDALILRRVRGGERIYMRESEVKASRLRVGALGGAVIQDGAIYYLISGVDGLRVTFDEVSQSLEIEAAPFFFETEQIQLTSNIINTFRRTSTGGFLAYDTFAQRPINGPGGSSAGAIFEFGGFSPLGGLSHGMVLRTDRSQRRALRLDTTLTIDRPEELVSWRIGDATSRSAAWGRPTRFAGVQYSTNFGTQPSLITYPLNVASGQTNLPSVVDVYVNNVLTGSRQVPAGPFTISDVPALNGQGEVRLVVRDILGRERAFATPLYNSVALLREGLSDFSFQAGYTREAFGLENAKYGRGFAAYLYRSGLSDRLTGEIASEIGSRTIALGLGAQWLWGRWGEFSAQYALSRRMRSAIDLPAPRVLGSGDSIAALPVSDGDGRSIGGTWTRTTRVLTLAVQGRVTSVGFRPPTLSDEAYLPRRELSGLASIATGYGSFAAGYTNVERIGQESLSLGQLTWSKSLREWGSVSISSFLSLRAGNTRSITFGYVLPLGPRSIVNYNHVRSRRNGIDDVENRASYQRSVPSGEGYGYRFDVSDMQRELAEWTAQKGYGVFQAAVARIERNASARVSASGSITYLGGQLSVGRRVEDAFALVQVPGFENVRVYLDNQEVGRTNARGNLFVPRLRPYQTNRLSIEQLDLPISAEVVTLKLDTTPYFKSGEVVRFEVRDSASGVVRFVDENGGPIASGALVTNLDTMQQFPVAERGEAFLTDLKKLNRLRVSFLGKFCILSFPFKRTDDPQPFLGVFTCRLK